MFISIEMSGKTALVVGGGRIAARKCLTLVRYGAEVRVIAPLLAASLQRLVRYGYVQHLQKAFSCGDLQSATLVFAATDQPEINRQVASEAKKLGIPVNVVDAPELSSFNSPAIVRRGDFSVAVATGGKAPSLSRGVRKQLALLFGREYAETVTLMGKIREKLLTQNDNRRYNKQILSRLANSGIPEMLRSELLKELDHLLLELCGPGFTLTELGMRKETTP